ncbi:MAG: carbon-monoxide dehydrogenase catalytic subunit [Desulfobacterales bacterium C00003060]|nr:MAG: carbon-monoxide dehydrogenase catalytic subunit [Desulfobacterales bacterium S3730MH5]OEU80124.1 MAG: carbon-monoxide dehydrogenase catalytic subunit [Desulfobacterales bacterium C00003060]
MKVTMKEMAQKRSIDRTAQVVIAKGLKEGVETAWERLEAQQPQCGYGQLGLCCTNCNMGPCRIDPFGEEPQKGVCGATADTIVARNLVRMLATGAAAHSDHGREVLEVLYETAKGRTQGYQITDVEKLKNLATEYDVSDQDKSDEALAEELALKILEEYGTVKNNLQFVQRAPEKRQTLWKSIGILPRSVDREIVETMHRVHMGVDQDYINILTHGLRTALSDGWGGSMMATEASDILFGTPKPFASTVNLAVLKEDMVNIVLHGHNPVLSEMVVKAASEDDAIQKAKAAGAGGINLAGMCCTGNELLMRRGIPIAGNMLCQELAIITGAVEAMVVDYQCIFPAVVDVANCYHTTVISTAAKARFPGATHMEFQPENAMDNARAIVAKAIENFPKRDRNRVCIPDGPAKWMAGFSVEALLDALGGTVNPLIEAIKSKQIRGVAGIVGCNNPRVQHDSAHVNIMERLIANNVLVVGTGCAMIAAGKAGLMVPEAAEKAGDGLRAVCQSLGVPPVLHMGSCVDCSRILVLVAALAKTLGVDMSDLPVVGSAPEWYSEKAVSIGSYFVASGVPVHLGLPPRILGSNAVTTLLTQGLQDVVGATFFVEIDPVKAADKIIAIIDEKRKALGI